MQALQCGALGSPGGGAAAFPEADVALMGVLRPRKMVSAVWERDSVEGSQQPSLQLSLQGHKAQSLLTRLVRSTLPPQVQGDWLQRRHVGPLRGCLRLLEGARRLLSLPGGQKPHWSSQPNVMLACLPGSGALSWEPGLG